MSKGRSTRRDRSQVAALATAVYAVVGAGFLVAIYALTPKDSRVVVLNAYAPALLAGLPGLWAWLRSRDAADSSRKAEEALNGNFDSRVKKNVHEALQEHEDSDDE